MKGVSVMSGVYGNQWKAESFAHVAWAPGLRLVRLGALTVWASDEESFSGRTERLSGVNQWGKRWASLAVRIGATELAIEWSPRG